MSEKELQELHAAGLTIEDVTAEPVDIWPDNEQAFKVFCSIRTQFRVSMNGPTGLDYNVMYHKLDRMNLASDEYERLEQDLQIMEVAALNKMNEKD